MHEYSLVRSLLSQLPEVVPSQDWPRLRIVTLAAGPLSGFEPLLASEAFEQLKMDYGLDGCRLEVEEETLRASCRSCVRDFEVEAFRFLCPDCGSGDVDVISGDGVRIASVTLVQTTDAGGEVTAENESRGSRSLDVEN